MVLLAGFLFSACSKDKFATVPKIEFVDISPNAFASDLTSLYKESAPKLVLKVTDSEGDFGSGSINDSSQIYIKNLLTNNLDSFPFPDLTRAPKKDFSAQVSINLFEALDCITPAPNRPAIDTNYFEVYITDAKRNKSNVITTTKPVYFECK